MTDSSNSPFTDLWTTVSNDRSRGSRELLTYTLDELEQRLSAGVDEEDRVRNICRQLGAVRPEMSIFASLAALLFQRWRKNSRKNLTTIIENLRNELRRSVNKHQSEFDRRLQRVDEVVVFSRSSTVLNLLRSTSERFETVHVLESHPGDEGVSVANELREDFRIQFWYDLELPQLLDEGEVVLLGADGLDESGRVLNKTGSRALAEVASETDVLVVTETLKLKPGSLNPQQVPTVDSPDSLHSDLGRDHPLFEVLPPRLIDGYLTDDGFFEDIAGLLRACDDLLDAHRSFPESVEEE